MSVLRRRLARLLALLVLLAGLLGPALPGFASMPPAGPSQTNAAMDCSGHRHQPAQHGSIMADCCIANLCAMNLALPAAHAAIMLPLPSGAPRYDRRSLLQPAGIVAAPIPHPPKAAA